MPLNWFSRPSKKKNPRLFDRLIDRAAPTWRYSPIRPVAQTVSLFAFLFLFLYVCFPTAGVSPPAGGSTTAKDAPSRTWPARYSEEMSRKEIVPAELFLAADPLVSLSTAIASRTWVWSLAFAAVVLLVCLVVPRGFCGYVCPLGTVIDLFDWTLGRRVRRFRLSGSGWYIHLKYYFLTAVLVAALFGVLISGFVAAIPVVTRAAAYLLAPLETGLLRSWHQVTPMNAGHLLSIALFAIVLGLGFFRRRFWCRYVCPSGAVFSVANALRLSERRVEASCIGCGKCVQVCPFDAIAPDFSTRAADCTFCQTCGGACPITAIRFVPRWRRPEKREAAKPLADEVSMGRRGFLAAGIGLTTAAIGGAATARSMPSGTRGVNAATGCYPIRPPGSVPEEAFLRQCIRCGACLQACPNDALHAQSFEQGVKGLWTPVVNADWAGCEPNCNNCGRVCPSGAIRVLPLEEKRAARIGLAVVDEQTCLPYAGAEPCRHCADECAAAGYGAIEFMTVGTQTDERGLPIEGTGMLAPVVVAEKCVGCGLCQTRCHSINVKAKHLLKQSAIVVEAGPGKEDRIASGSYRALRAEEERRREAQREKETEPDGGGSYLPDFLK